MNKITHFLELILNMNERLFLNSLIGITDEQANERISDHNNPLIWIATHTVWARYNMLIFLGQPTKNPFEGKFENFKAYDPSEKYPSLDSLKKEWKNASQLLKVAFQQVSEDVLSADSPLKSPIGEFTNGGTLSFLVQHESYDIGQMAFLKKYLTVEAMTYN